MLVRVPRGLPGLRGPAPHCWIAKIQLHIEDPKPGYVADWDQLPEWRQETDVDISDAIEHALASTV